MEIEIRADSVEISGYVNAVERNSKPIRSRMGTFIERICKGAFFDALKQRSDSEKDVKILLNHDWRRELGSTLQGTLELEEDNIGLHARAIVTDADVVEKAKRGDLVGWSFGFRDKDVEYGSEDGMPIRKVRALDLEEVSILDRTKNPAYEGTLVLTRAEGDLLIGEEYLDAIGYVEETKDLQEQTEERAEQLPGDPERQIDYTRFDQMIEEMKGAKDE